MVKMKAALMYGPNDIRIEQVDKPVCSKDGMIVNIKAVGLCGSDMRNLTTDSCPGNYPCIYGHEYSGVISEVGPQARTKFKVGDRVYVSPVSYGPDSEVSLGGFAEYIFVPAWHIENRNILALPDHVKYENATIAEPLSSVYSSQSAVDVKIGETVVILGAGPIGCLHSQLAKKRGASKVIMIDINDERLEMASDFEIDHAINSKKLDPIEEVKKYTNGLGANHVICANSSVDAQEEAVYMCASGGVVTLFGGVAKNALAQIDTNHVHYSNMWLYGHFAFTMEENRKSFELICSGQFNSEKYITHVLPLDEINKAIDLARTGKSMKTILIP